MNSAVSYRRARTVYARLEPGLRRDHDGEYVAVEPASENYVVGPDELLVALEARRRYPGKKFGFFRVGRRAAHKLRKGSRTC